jgi:outer membrane lipoprotein-sorting protein
MRRRRAFCALVTQIIVAATCRTAFGVTAREILDKAKTLDDTTRKWTDRTQHMVLTIHDSGGAERQRDVKVFTKRDADGEEKAISFFLGPHEVQGVAFLQWAHKGREDEQWLYLPELKRTRQIAARLRDEPFMSTDFSFRDLEIIVEFLRWSEDEAPAKLVGEENIGGTMTDVIELRPRMEGMPYEKLVVWIDRDKLVARKLDFYAREGMLVKTLTLDDVRDAGAIPTPHRLEMRNLKKGSRTVVELPEVVYNTGLSDDLFTQRYLDHGPP